MSTQKITEMRHSQNIYSVNEINKNYALTQGVDYGFFRTRLNKEKGSERRELHNTEASK